MHKFKLYEQRFEYLRYRLTYINFKPFKDEAQIALFKDPVRTAL